MERAGLLEPRQSWGIQINDYNKNLLRIFLHKSIHHHGLKQRRRWTKPKPLESWQSLARQTNDSSNNNNNKITISHGEVTALNHKVGNNPAWRQERKKQWNNKWKEGDIWAFSRGHLRGEQTIEVPTQLTCGMSTPCNEGAFQTFQYPFHRYTMPGSFPMKIHIHEFRSKSLLREERRCEISKSW